MNDEDLNKIRGIIKEELEPTNQKIGNIEQKLDVLWDQTVTLTENMNEVKETLKSHSEALKRIEEKHGGNIGKLSKRVTTTEIRLGISTPPELTVIE